MIQPGCITITLFISKCQNWNVNKSSKKSKWLFCHTYWSQNQKLISKSSPCWTWETLSTNKEPLRVLYIVNLTLLYYLIPATWDYTYKKFLMLKWYSYVFNLFYWLWLHRCSLEYLQTKFYYFLKWIFWSPCGWLISINYPFLINMKKWESASGVCDASPGWFTLLHLLHENTPMALS